MNFFPSLLRRGKGHSRSLGYAPNDKPETGALSAAYPTQAQRQGLTPISCHAVLERSACAPFIKERRMECINATNLHRKSGQWGTQRLLLVQEGGSLHPHSQMLADKLS